MKNPVVSRNSTYGSQLDHFRYGLSSFFDKFFDESANWMDGAGWSPELEIHEENSSLVVKADLPGVSKDDINISLEKGMLTISGERKEEQEKKQGKRVITERRYGSFCRSINLPQGVDTNKIKADYSNGVLTVTVPRNPKEKRQVAIKVK